MSLSVIFYALSAVVLIWAIANTLAPILWKSRAQLAMMDRAGRGVDREPTPKQKAHLAEKLEAMGARSVYIKRDGRPLAIGVSSPGSYFGGLPKLPNGVAWPEYEQDGARQAMTFLGQIDLSELPDAGRNSFPEAGRLLFFAYSDFSMLMEPERKDWAKVIYLSAQDPEAQDHEAPDNLMQLGASYPNQWFAGEDDGWIAERAARPRVARRYAMRFAAYVSYPDTDGMAPAAGWDHGSLHEELLGPLREVQQQDLKRRLYEGVPRRSARTPERENAVLGFEAPFIWRELRQFLSDIEAELAPYREPDAAMREARAETLLDDSMQDAALALVQDACDLLAVWRARAVGRGDWETVTEADNDEFRKGLSDINQRMTNLRREVSPFLWRELSDTIRSYKLGVEIDERNLQGMSGTDALRQSEILIKARAFLSKWENLAAAEDLDKPIKAEARSLYLQELDGLRTHIYENGGSFVAKGYRNRSKCPLHPDFLPGGLDHRLNRGIVDDSLRTAAELGLDVEALFPGWVIDAVIPEPGVEATAQSNQLDFEWDYGPHQMLGYGTTVQWAPVQNRDKVLLLQLHSDEALGWFSGSCVLQFWIDKSDFKRRQFHKAFATIECN